LSGISEQSWHTALEKTAERKYAERHWPVYEEYREIDVNGHRYIRVPKEAYFVEKVRSIDPFALDHAGLFLKFARWFDERKMDTAGEPNPEYGPTGLETPRNVEANLAWAHEYGVLGLGHNDNEIHAMGGPIGSSSSQIAARLLGAPDLGHNGTRGYRKSARGGKRETVERFVREAREANVVLKLYEAVVAEDVDTISQFMANEKPTYAYGGSPSYARYTERETWAKDAELARSWGLSVVENAVNSKVENDVYPILLGKPYSYEDLWGFKSLLGAMWFQMRKFMLAGDSCPMCGEVFPRRRPNMVYCSEQCGNRYRAAKSDERKREQQKRAREATRRKLQGERRN
jgi:hypothetical protein